MNSKIAVILSVTFLYESKEKDSKKTKYSSITLEKETIPLIFTMAIDHFSRKYFCTFLPEKCFFFIFGLLNLTFRKNMSNFINFLTF